MIRLSAALIVACCIGLVGSAHESELVTRDAYLMGTRARLSVRARDRAAGLSLLNRALAVLEEAERELSTWRADSAISRLNRTPVGVPWLARDRLCVMFATVYAWQRESGGAFDPAIGTLLDAWQVHDAGRVPTDAALARAHARSGLELLRFSERACTLTRLDDVGLDVGAFGKGEALDRAAATLAGHQWMIDLGGQVSVGVSTPGLTPWTIDLAHPTRRTQPVAQVRVQGGSLATSGGSERDHVTRSSRIGHILDPRTGRPAPSDGSVTVWHEHGLVADILSTALYVMGPREGLRWAEKRGLSAVYLRARGKGVERLPTTAFAALIVRE